MNYLSKALGFGTQDTNPPQLQRRILFSNVIYITITAVYCVYFLLDFKVYLTSPLNLKIDQWSVPLIMVYCLGGLLLNLAGRSYVSRISFLIIWPVLLHILPIMLMQTPADYYIAYPLGLILHAIFIQFFISARCEPKTFWTFMTINFLLLVFAKQFLFYNDQNLSVVAQEGIVNSGYYSMILVLYWLLFNFMTFYILKVMDSMIDKISSQQSVLQKSNSELLKLLSQVESTNREMEVRLSQHKSEVEQVVNTYAHLNAHTIRGPYCRLKGILMLKELQVIADEDYEKTLQETMKDLEVAIGNMQDEMNNTIQQLSIFNGKQLDPWAEVLAANDKSSRTT